MKRKYRVRNWKDYNKSLVGRGSLTFWFSPEVLKEWEKCESAEGHGNQRYSNWVITCGLSLRQLFRLPLRATQGLMRSIAEHLKLAVVAPNYTTLCRRSKDLKINLGAKPSEKGRDVLVDSTGVQIVGGSEWRQVKYGVSPKNRWQQWRKLHVVMDAESRDILAAKLTESVCLDGNYLPGLIEEIPGHIEAMIGDGAYDKKGCYECAYRREAKAIFPVQHNARIQRNKHKKEAALMTRDEAIVEIGKGEERWAGLKKWKERTGYHKRSRIETLMFRMKTLFGDQIRSRTFERQRTDVLIRCYAINKMNLLGLPISEPI